ncbi:MAG: DNRLRE domain-containing protein [Phycisphaerales bacterium]|nr:DNRLRE domain-containing protein [Phycisphaerales bacterium]
MLCLLLIAAALAQPQPLAPANHGGHYIEFYDRESSSPPRLVLTDKSGVTREVDPRADSTICSVQPDQPLFNLREMRVSLGDAYRALLRFDDDLGESVERAELILTIKPGESMPVEPFELAIFELTEPWPEMSITWSRQPAARDAPLATIRFDPSDAEVRIDVSASVQRWLAEPESNRGWVIKAAAPLAVIIDPNVKSADFEKQILQLHGWAGSVDAACDQAAREGKLVLAVIRAGHTDDQAMFLEQMLLSIVLAEPDVRLLVRERFVPVRIRVDPMALMNARGGLLDALASGSAAERQPFLKRARPLALMALHPDKKPVDQLTNIGSFDPSMIHQFLLAAIAQSATSQPASAPADPWKMIMRGDVSAAKASFQTAEGTAHQLGLARIALIAGDWNGTVDLCDKLIARDDAIADNARALRGIALMRLGRFDDAYQTLHDVGDGADEFHASAAAYYLACLQQRRGEPKAATKTWQRLSAGRQYTAPYAAKAQARLFYSDGVAMYECLAAVPRPAGESLEIRAAESDLDRIESRAVDYLLSQQRPDGTWPNGLIAMYNPAITALTGKALLRMRSRVDEARAARVDAAVEAASAVLDKFVAESAANSAECFSTAYVLDFLLDRFEQDAAGREATQRAVELVIGGQCPNGAWSYNPDFDKNWRGGFGGWPKTDKGRTHSMNTAPSMLALLRARRLGLAVGDDVLSRGRDALLKMRQAPARFTYTYPDPICFAEASQSIGRAPACEQVLLQMNAAERTDLGLSIENFMRYRVELRKPAKVTQAWISPIGTSSYFYFFAYYHAALVITELGGEERIERLKRLRDDVLSVMEADGTWIDDEQIGKVYGTAMALLIFDLARSE